ncbi:MAG: hypothetical protein A3A24_03995 [Candidatus Buchananbacteria bacterium RIFCSPLOWO2_01_FULL_46_12]|uniref:Uncharacterized protein n=1 Tax=Candidatus Buchananbacteria bacterium RIFCSPLOWO2_01_FULL_46_12 TaxID=1797546 RepID=A0A1G1YTI0_9BACT|nr:MAG: hypothetical protein A3A24_03995 [Candidatus Buchananbacteria bacterium RIFCSPLOWO2_01_FULL_46_12]
MTRFIDREKARALRAKGKSYSEIKEQLKVGKGTLSVWLADMPLTHEQMRKVRDFNPRRIERFRKTMKNKRDARLKIAYERARKDIGTLSRRDLFIAGLYLYWGEGNKSGQANVGISNTDPAVILAFLDWAKVMGMPRERMYVRMHLYVDMDIKRETLYWSKMLKLPLTQFRKPYIKTSALSGLAYKTFGHGTCNVRFENMPMWEYITMALTYLRERHTRP